MEYYFIWAYNSNDDREPVFNIHTNRGAQKRLVVPAGNYTLLTFSEFFQFDHEQKTLECFNSWFNAFNPNSGYCKNT